MSDENYRPTFLLYQPKYITVQIRYITITLKLIPYSCSNTQKKHRLL